MEVAKGTYFKHPLRNLICTYLWFYLLTTKVGTGFFLPLVDGKVVRDELANKRACWRLHVCG